MSGGVNGISVGFPQFLSDSDLSMVWQQGFLFSVEPLTATTPPVSAPPAASQRRPERKRRSSRVANSSPSKSATDKPADSSTRVPTGAPTGEVVPTGVAEVDVVGRGELAETEALPEGMGESSRTRVERLRGALRRLRGRGAVSGEERAEVFFSAGGEVLDQLLPHGGLRPGTLVEWVEESPGSGARLLATLAAASWLAHPATGDKPLVIADGWSADETFYPPAIISLGIPAERMVVFRKPTDRGREAATRADLIWAIDQALRSGAVAGVLVDVGEGLSVADARRLQLAAETGAAMLLCLRQAAVNTGGINTGARARVGIVKRSKLVSVADVRWGVSSLPGTGGRRLRVELVRCRGGVAGAARVVEIDPRGLAWDVGSRFSVPAEPRPGGMSAVAVREASSRSANGGIRDAGAALAGDLVGRLADPTSPSSDVESDGIRRIG